MKKARKHHSASDKVAIIRRHLVEKVSVSDLCDQYHLRPTLFYKWQKQFFDNGAAAFEQSEKRTLDSKDRQIAALESKLQRKNEVVSELMEEHVQLKKELGDFEWHLGPPRHPRCRDRLRQSLV